MVRVDTQLLGVMICVLAYPRGACWDLCFFSIYCLGLDDIFKRHQLQYHMYADDTQLYVELPREQQVPTTAASNRIALCTADVKTWMASHNLLLNEQKTEVVIAARNRSRVHRPVVVAIDVCGVSVTPKPSIRDFGVEIEDTMSMAVHVRRVCQVAYCHIRSITKIRKCLTTAAFKTIVHVLAMSRVDYGNALLFGLAHRSLTIPRYNLERDGRRPFLWRVHHCGTIYRSQ